MKVSTHGLDIAKAAGQRDGLPMTQIVGKVTQDRQGLYDRKRDRIAEARSRAHCHYPREPRVGKLENRLILPFASNQANKISRHQRRDRLLNDDECEAA